MIFRQFCAADNEISYLLADPFSREAAVLDPNSLTEEEYLKTLELLDLKLAYVLLTRDYAMHRGIAEKLCSLAGAKLVLSGSDGTTVDGMPIDDGDSEYIGEESIDVIGATEQGSDVLCYHWRDQIFTGHALLAGMKHSEGRAQRSIAKDIETIWQRLFLMPQETLIYPGRVNEGQRLSSIGQEKNWFLIETTQANRNAD